MIVFNLMYVNRDCDYNVRYLYNMSSIPSLLNSYHLTCTQYLPSPHSASASSSPAPLPPPPRQPPHHPPHTHSPSPPSPHYPLPPETSPQSPMPLQSPFPWLSNTQPLPHLHLRPSSQQQQHPVQPPSPHRAPATAHSVPPQAHDSDC